MQTKLAELERRLRSTFGGWAQYRRRVWQECRSFEAASSDERIRIAQQVLADPHKEEWVWCLGGHHMLLGEVTEKLNDTDPHIRADAIVALADFGSHAGNAVPLLLDRLSTATIHERTLAAWALPIIGAGPSAIPVLLQVLTETADQPEADQLRLRAAQAIEALSDSFQVLVPLARRCLSDRDWKSRLFGLTLVERLGKRNRRILEMLVPSVRQLLDDDVEEVRVLAQGILAAFERGELQN